MYLVFDTETTGKPKKWNLPYTNTDNWPRLVQLSWLVFNKNYEEIDRQDHIIFPEGFTIPSSVVKVHGISTARAKKEGKSLVEVLEKFAKAIEHSDYLIGHNISFDENVAGAEFVRTDIANTLFATPRICTMKQSTEHCKLPGKYGYKWPSLAELHFKLFGEKFSDAHNALADAEATARCFFKLLTLNALKLKG